jgi:5-methylcytosine-specific restriction endonuclease McrA
MEDFTKREIRQAFYNTAEWKALRKYVLSIEPLCRRCKVENKLVPASVVDHIIDISDNPDIRLDVNNLQPLCKSCHSSKTIKKLLKSENSPNITRKKQNTFKIYNSKWKI